MHFDDPFYMDPDSFEDLMADTDQRRLCWMYHDVLSQPGIARLMDQAAGKDDAPDGGTTMAWVAAGHQGFYLLFKWYEEFYDPPCHSDLYFLRWGQDGQVRVRYLNRDFQEKLPPRGLDWFDSFLSRVSDNACSFFGESDFLVNPVGRLLRLLEQEQDRALERFDWQFGDRSDGEKALLCATLSAYFQSIQAMGEILGQLIPFPREEDRENEEDTGPTLLESLATLTMKLYGPHLSELGDQFTALAETFGQTPDLVPTLSRSAGRLLLNQTEAGAVEWLHLNGRSARQMLRDLYARCAPQRMWDVIYRWQGDLYFTVCSRPLGPELPRGIYLLCQFQDQQGQWVLDLFWLETLSVGTVHRCQGEVLPDLAALLGEMSTIQTSLGPLRRWGGNLVAGYSALLKETFDRYDGGFV